MSNNTAASRLLLGNGLEEDRDGSEVGYQQRESGQWYYEAPSTKRGEKGRDDRQAGDDRCTIEQHPVDQAARSQVRTLRAACGETHRRADGEDHDQRGSRHRQQRQYPIHDRSTATAVIRGVRRLSSLAGNHPGGFFAMQAHQRLLCRISRFYRAAARHVFDYPCWW